MSMSTSALRVMRDELTADSWAMGSPHRSGRYHRLPSRQGLVACRVPVRRTHLDAGRNIQDIGAIVKRFVQRLVGPRQGGRR
jgi:hypothetical protein